MASIFDEAKVAYKNCIDDLTVMGNATEQIMANKGKKFDTRILLNQFDVLLQYSLLQVALADGTLAGEELTFIMDLSQYYPLPEFLKSVGYKNATWQVVYNTNEQKLNGIINELKNDVEKLSQDFINIFSAFDSATDHNYFDELKRNIGVIIAATCQADGKAENIEIKKGCFVIDVMAQINSKLRK